VSLLQESYNYRAGLMKTTASDMLEADRLVLVAGVTLQNYMDVAFARATSGDADGLQGATRVVSAAAKQILDIAEAEIENTDDQERKDVLAVRGQTGEGARVKESTVTVIAAIFPICSKRPAPWRVRAACARGTWMRWRRRRQMRRR
jgi:hypothetical protein